MNYLFLEVKGFIKLFKPLHKSWFLNFNTIGFVYRLFVIYLIMYGFDLYLFINNTTIKFNIFISRISAQNNA